MQVATRAEVFEEIFLVFLALGTLIGIIVVAYTVYNAYKYRDVGDRGKDDNLPTLGELPTGGGSGKKLFLSFFLSAVVVISLIVWTYGMLLYVEDGPDELDEDAIEIDVDAQAFSFSYTYDNGIESSQLVVPHDEAVSLSVTSTDVWHTFGISQERVKADALPGEVDETWFAASSEPGEHEDAVECFELCGGGHTNMKGDMVVLEDMDAYDEWVDDQLDLHVTVLDTDVPETDDGEEGEPEPFTGDFEAEVVHNETGDTYTFDQDDVDENGTYTIGDIEQGGDFTITITPADDAYETYEAEISHTGSTGGEEHEAELQLAEDDSEDNGGEN